CVFACYDIPNVHIDGFDVVVNKPATSAYRAPGATNAAFAAESVVDEICEKLKIDPLDFRLKNAAREGTRRADGPTYPRVGMIETVEAAKKHPHYTSPLAGPNRGRGVASGFWFNCGLKSSATASVNAGVLRCKTDDGKRLTFKELAEKLHATGGTIVGRASVDPTGVGGGFATHVVDVEVDPETGKVTILRYTAVQDVGQAIHPSYVEG